MAIRNSPRRMKKDAIDATNYGQFLLRDARSASAVLLS